MSLHRASSATRPLCGLDNKILLKNVTVLLFFPLRFVFPRYANFLSSQTNYKLFPGQKYKWYPCFCYSARQREGQRGEGAYGPTNADSWSTGSSRVFWLALSLLLSLSLSPSLSLSRCDGVFTLDILLLNNAVLHIHCSIITNTDFACKPDPFCPLCVHLSDLQIFRLKEVTEDST